MSVCVCVCTGVSCGVFCGHKGDEVISVLRFTPGAVPGSIVVHVRLFVVGVLQHSRKGSEDNNAITDVLI